MAKVVEVKNVTKKFIVPHDKRDTLKSRFTNPFKKVSKDEFWALNDVSFDVEEGEFVSIIGKNGSGKSTLLKMLANIYTPTTGEIKVHGSLVPFLELGVGFNHDLTGRENIFLNGTILGMTRKYLEKKFDEIVAFAELEDFIDLQVKNYSSGMLMRLAFAVAVQARADIYLLDEILSVGDVGFQKKSLQKMQSLIGSGSTVILVSHSLNDVRRLSDRVIFLEKGKKVYEGDVDEAIKQYQFSLMTNEEKEKYKWIQENSSVVSDIDEIEKNIEDINKMREALQNKSDQGDGRARISSLVVRNQQGKLTDSINLGEDIEIEVEFEILGKIENPVVLVSLNDGNRGLIDLNTNREEANMLKSVDKGDTLKVTFNTVNKLLPGKYNLWVHLGDPNLYGKGTNRLASVIKNAKKISVNELSPEQSLNKSGTFAQNFSYKYEINSQT